MMSAKSPQAAAIRAYRSDLPPPPFWLTIAIAYIVLSFQINCENIKPKVYFWIPAKKKKPANACFYLCIQVPDYIME